ncbi:hypothetical protein AALM51_14580 [Enterobacter roggenkampii]|uniref:hypothetical protein n=1 Tax=Enterobacter roggenkampii TaxID=1812935 RepID=UPI0032AEE7AE
MVSGSYAVLPEAVAIRERNSTDVLGADVKDNGNRRAYVVTVVDDALAFRLESAGGSGAGRSGDGL